MRAPHFTVVVPVRNGAATLQAALNSVQRQTFRSWECIIVDDGSSDRSLELAFAWARQRARQARVLIHENRANLGVAASRNAAVALARTPWVAFLDQDDIWNRTKLEIQAKFIRSHPDLLAVASLARIAYHGAPRNPVIDNWAQAQASIAERSYMVDLRDVLHFAPFCMSSVVARTSEVRTVGGFDVSLRWTSDWLMWACVSTHGPIGIIDKELVTYVIHSSNDVKNLLRKPFGLIHAAIDVHERLARYLQRTHGMPLPNARRYVESVFYSKNTTDTSTIPCR